MEFRSLLDEFGSCGIAQFQQPRVVTNADLPFQAQGLPWILNPQTEGRYGNAHKFVRGFEK
jgi:hypothetical protein